MIDTVLSNPGLEQIQRIISVKFGVDLTQKQLLNLLDTQPEEQKKGLLEEKIDPVSLDMLIESVSKEITGMHYPTEHSTPYFRAYYQKMLIENRDSFFGSL